MDNKKIMAVFAVLVMVLGCLTCVAATSDNDASATLEDQGPVVLDASKDFKYNEKQLNKLGINDPSKWIKEKDKTTLILDDVDYRTKNAHALAIWGICANLVIEVRGDNTIACGTEKAEWVTYTDAIWIGGGVWNTNITGTGTLNIVCEGTHTDNGGSALYAEGNLTISQCKLIAVGPNVNQTEDVKGDYSSNGICLDHGNLTVNAGAKVFAYGGDVFAKGECYYDDEKHSTKSTGVYVSVENEESTLTMDNAVLYAFGGDVESQAPGFYVEGTPNMKIDVTSTGLYISGKINLNKSILRGYGGDATGDKSTTESTYKHVSSEGMKFNADITAVESEIFMIGGKAVSSELAVSAGMRHFGILGTTGAAKSITISLDNSDIYAFGNSITGGSEGRGVMSGSVGLFASEVGTNASSFNLTIYLKQSVANFTGFRGADNSNGLRILANTTGEPAGAALKGTITVDDSDFYAFGNSCAMYATEVKANGVGYTCVASTSYYDAGKPVDPSELTNYESKYKTCALCYHYNLYTFAFDSIYTPIMSYAFDEEKAKLPGYEMSFTPEGKKFKCWMVNGEEMRPGQIVDMTHGPVYAFAVWEDDNGSGDNNIWLWVLLIVVVIIILALIIIIALRHSSDEKPKAKPVAKKKTSRKAAAESEEETTVSKPKAKKTTTKKASSTKKTTSKRTTAKKTTKPKARKTSKR